MPVLSPIDVEATLACMIYVTLPASYANIFEKEFPFGENDHCVMRTLSHDGVTVQFNLYVDLWHQRYAQAQYLLGLGRILYGYGHRCYLVNYGPASKFKKGGS